jgi:ribulose-phosphate 3-epimerase
VHVENGQAGFSAIDQIRQAGKSAGVAVRLETDLEQVIPYLDLVDLVLLMGTPLGVKGQGLAPQAVGRIQALRQLIESQDYAEQVKIFADGGIRQSTVPALRAAGANAIIPGSLVFSSADAGETLRWMHSLT